MYLISGYIISVISNQVSSFLNLKPRALVSGFLLELTNNIGYNSY